MALVARLPFSSSAIAVHSIGGMTGSFWPYT
ncbi:hypothetical protein B23_2180 [Geobacillus thermoleovorans B23]|nr:hypothetical protein B23_2180 [Geobacillus thermoleovorans B23]